MGLNRDQLASIAGWHPNIRDVREIPFRGGRGWAYRVLLPLIQRVPWLGARTFSLVHLRCR